MTVILVINCQLVHGGLGIWETLWVAAHSRTVRERMEEVGDHEEQAYLKYASVMFAIPELSFRFESNPEASLE